MKVLYQIDNNGQTRVWTIRVEEFILVIEHGIAGGKMIKSTEAILEGKGSRTIDQQIDSRLNSRIAKQKLRGYRDSILEAKTMAGKNELDLFKPMLAQQFNKQKSVNTKGAVLQRKLDGNRMLVTKQNGNLQAYTRNGKPIETLNHIIEQMDWLKEGQTVDGEVYKHGMALKDIRGGVAKLQDSTLELDYHIYDIVGDAPFKDRFELYNMGDSCPTNICIEPYWYYRGKENMEALFNAVRKYGYEGLMMRLDNVGYQAGKRSKGLLKIKFRYDAEYPVIDIISDKNGRAILIMRLPNDKTVKGVAPGTKKEKEFVLENAEHYIGRQVTCSFAYLTDFGIPFHLVCEGWR